MRIIRGRWRRQSNRLKGCIREGGRAERGTRNSECGTKEGKGGTRNAELGMRNKGGEGRNAERGTRNAEQRRGSAERGTRNSECGTKEGTCRFRNRYWFKCRLVICRWN